VKPRHTRAALIAAALAALGVSAALILNAFRSNIVFFVTPSQVARKEVAAGRGFRLGGLVQEGSLKRDGLSARFVITDRARSVPVTYAGVLPDLFKEGKGVVAQGQLDASGVFRASEVLAKHDENYMPPDAAKALKRAQADAAARGTTVAIRSAGK
jgi:cytochrome c-type biogenesis protein CcmE